MAGRIRTSSFTEIPRAPLVWLRFVVMSSICQPLRCIGLQPFPPYDLFHPPDLVSGYLVL